MGYPEYFSALGAIGGCRFSSAKVPELEYWPYHSLSNRPGDCEFVFTAFLSPIMRGRYMSRASMFEESRALPAMADVARPKRTSDEIGNRTGESPNLAKRLSLQDQPSRRPNARYRWWFRLYSSPAPIAGPTLVSRSTLSILGHWTVLPLWCPAGRGLCDYKNWHHHAQLNALGPSRNSEESRAPETWMQAGGRAATTRSK